MRLATLVLAVLVAATLPTAAAGGARWERLPPAPVPARLSESVGVWTGKEMIVFGRAQLHPPWSVDVAAAYNPATRTWRTLHPFAGPKGNFEGRYQSVWTGRLMLVVGPFDDQSYDPRTNLWRRLPKPHLEHPLGVVVWTGRELVSWGGGCCGDASSDGVAFDPTKNTWRKLAASPLAPSNGPQGAWDGRELVVLVSGFDPDGNPYPARLARAAAYNPATNTWRRIAAPPEHRSGAVGVWDGENVLFIGGSPTRYGGTARTTIGLAYDPARNRWSRLPATPAFAYGFAAVRAGGRILAWGGVPARGAEYVPAAGRWFALPPAPLRARDFPALVWTGRLLLVWGGQYAAGGAEFSL
jgi:hypothetical protein